MSGGKPSIQNTLKILNMICEAPIPTMLPLMYLGGNMPTSPNIPFCMREEKAPKVIMAMFVTYHDTDSLISWERIGIITSHTMIPTHPIKILGSKPRYFSKNIPINMKMNRGPFNVSGITNVGS